MNECERCSPLASRSNGAHHGLSHTTTPPQRRGCPERQPKPLAISRDGQYGVASCRSQGWCAHLYCGPERPADRHLLMLQSRCSHRGLWAVEIAPSLDLVLSRCHLSVCLLLVISCLRGVSVSYLTDRPCASKKVLGFNTCSDGPNTQ